MAAAIIQTIRKRNAELIEDTEDSDPLMENLIISLPPKDEWLAEYSLGILLVG